MPETEKPENWTLPQINARLPDDARTRITKNIHGAASVAVVRKVLSGESLPPKQARLQALVLAAARQLAGWETQRQRVAALRSAVWSMSEAEVVAFFTQHPLPADVLETAHREAARHKKRTPAEDLRDTLWIMTQKQVAAFFEENPLPATIKLW